MNNLPTDVKRIQVNVIKETLNQPARKLKLDDNGMLTLRMPDGSILKGNPVDLFNSDNDIRVVHEVDLRRLPRVNRVALLDDDERSFLEAVEKFPGAKHAWGGVYIREDKEPVWKRPEELGLVECVGSWKWNPILG